LLLDRLDPLPGARVLVIGPGAPETVRDLIRGGCATVTAIPEGESLPGAELADAAVVLQDETLVKTEAAIATAARAMIRGGRIVLREAADRLVPTLAAMLRANGFCPVEVWATADGTVLTAERPFFGPLHRPGEADA
jgi:hypothetical protein